MQETINIVSIIVVLLSSLFFGVYFAKKLRVKRAHFDELGLILVDRNDPELKNRIIALYPGDNPPDIDFIQLRRLPRGQATVYVMDFISPSDEKEGWFAKNGVAIVSDELNVPRVSLVQKFDPNPSMNVVRKGLKKAIQRITMDAASESSGFRPIAIPENPELEEKFIVKGIEESEIQSLLSNPGIIPTLIYSHHYWMEAMGDTILIDSDKELRMPEHESIREDIEHAMRLYQLFKEF